MRKSQLHRIKSLKNKRKTKGYNTCSVRYRMRGRIHAKLRANALSIKCSFVILQKTLQFKQFRHFEGKSLNNFALSYSNEPVTLHERRSFVPSSAFDLVSRGRILSSLFIGRNFGQSGRFSDFHASFERLCSDRSFTGSHRIFTFLYKSFSQALLEISWKEEIFMRFRLLKVFNTQRKLSFA